MLSHLSEAAKTAICAFIGGSIALNIFLAVLWLSKHLPLTCTFN